MALTYEPRIFRNSPEVRSAMTLRGSREDRYGHNYSLGVGDDPERVRRNRAWLAGRLGFPVERLAVQHQVHGNAVAIVAEGYAPGESDALVGSEPGWLLAVSVADCAPVLLYDPTRRAIGAVHSGWRGTAQNLAGITINSLRRDHGTDPSDLLVYVGPCAGQCCYEVGADVADRFPHRYSKELGGGKFLFDNRGAVLQQLMDAGVSPSKIELDQRCTICDPELHSYRRDGARSGRMLAVIGLIGGREGE